MPTRVRTDVLPVVFLTLGAWLPPPSARAAGFAIFEQGARGMGFAGAYTAQSSDASAIFHNAAGIAFLKGKRLYAGGTLIRPRSDFTGAGPFPGPGVREESDAGFLVPPSADYSQPFSERLVVGIGLHQPYGLRTRWKNRESTFSGRFLSKRAELKSYSINPTLAYKLADRLAVGGGLDVRFSNVGLDRNVPVVNPFTQKVADAAALELRSGSEMGYGFNLGALAKPTESLAVGVAYRHKVSVDFKGDATFTLKDTGNTQLNRLVAQSLPEGSVPVTTAVDFPSLLTLGAMYSWNDWVFAADLGFQQWSSFDTLEIAFQGRPDLRSEIRVDYADARIYRAGVERRLNDAWAVRGGYFFDESPAPTEAVSPVLPDADRHGIAAGGTWQRGRMRIDAASWLVLFKDRFTQGRDREYSGTYKSRALLFAVSVGYDF
jgi:long-chain fatty acid transport protein